MACLVASEPRYSALCFGAVGRWTRTAVRPKGLEMSTPLGQTFTSCGVDAFNYCCYYYDYYCYCDFHYDYQYYYYDSYYYYGDLTIDAKCSFPNYVGWIAALVMVMIVKVMQNTTLNAAKVEAGGMSPPASGE